jgi:hypothetical protein
VTRAEIVDNPIHLKISMGPALREVVAECFRSQIVSPYLIHYKPKVQLLKHMEAKDHWA